MSSCISIRRTLRPAVPTEAKAFRDSHEAFTQTDSMVVGVSQDSIETHLRFSNSCGLPFKILSDVANNVKDFVQRPFDHGDVPQPRHIRDR